MSPVIVPSIFKLALLSVVFALTLAQPVSASANLLKCARSLVSRSATTANPPSAAIDRPRRFLGLFRRAKPKANGPAYDRGAYLAYRKQLETLEIEDLVGVTRTDAGVPIELLIAMVDKYDRNAVGERRSLIDVLESGTRREKRRLEAIFSSLRADRNSVEGGFYRSQVQSLLVASYLITHPTALGLFESLLPRRQIKETLRQHIETELMTDDIVRHLEFMGFQRNLDPYLTMHEYLRRNPYLTKLPLSAAINSISLSFLGVPLSMPPIDLLRWSEIPTPLKQSVRENGFDATYELIQAHYRSRGLLDYSWNRARGAFRTFATVIVATVIVQHGPMAITLVKAGLVTNQEVIDLQQAKYPPHAARELQLENFKEYIRLAHNREPTPAEIARKAAELQALPDSTFILR